MLTLAAVLLLTGFGHGPRVRPVECGALPGERGANVWERAKIPALRPYCDLVASAAAKLTPGSQRVGEVPALTDQAEALVPGRAAPLVLKGRALAELGDYAGARAALATAETRDAHAFDDPLALLAWARSLTFTGDVTGARAAYRELLPRADVLALADRGVAYLGAGVLSMMQGPAAIGETIAILRQGRRDSHDLVHAAATFALALALDRAGDSAEAAAVLAEDAPGDAARVLSDPRVVRVLEGRVNPGRPSVHGEALAMEALAAELAGTREAARAAWKAYVASGASQGVWQGQALAHLGSAPPKGTRP
jgi:tetratricopeptide (TPR) repeat protein